MATLFRKILIRLGKIIPFILALIVALGYLENIYSITTYRIAISESGFEYFYCPISTFLFNIVTIDVFDIILLYILAIALEFCKYNMRTVRYLAFNLVIKFVVEHFELQNCTIIGLSVFMALFGLFCLYGGFKMIKYQKGKF